MNCGVSRIIWVSQERDRWWKWQNGDWWVEGRARRHSWCDVVNGGGSFISILGTQCMSANFFTLTTVSHQYVYYLQWVLFYFKEKDNKIDSWFFFFYINSLILGKKTSDNLNFGHEINKVKQKFVLSKNWNEIPMINLFFVELINYLNSIIWLDSWFIFDDEF